VAVSISVGAPAEQMGWVPSPRIRRILERGKTFEREGRPVIFLKTGRPDFDTPVHVRDTLRG